MLKNIIKSLIILAIIFVLTLAGNIMTALAVSESDLDDIEDKINDKKEELDHVEEELEGALAQIQSLNAEIAEYENDISDLNSQIAEVSAQIETAEIEIKQAEEDYKEQQEKLEQRLVAIYKTGDTTYLDVLLSSKDIVDFISKYHQVERIAECDQNLLQQIEANRKSIEENKVLLETSKEQIETLKSDVEDKANSLKETQTAKQSYVDELSDEEKALQEEIEKLEEEQEKIEIELKEAENKYRTEIAELEGSGTLKKPISGGVVTCNMYYSSGKYHGAIDWGISSGTKIYASEEGIILQAGWSSSGYGYMVCIQHANGLRTYYAHGNGTFYVEEGQKVERGQLIMLSGNSGNSSGPHLHFEVRVSPYNWNYGGGDSRRDPRIYLE